MRIGITSSILLHVLIAILFIYEMPNLFKKELLHDYAMVVDVVDISELTNVKVQKSKKSAEEKATKKKAPKAQTLAVEKKPQEKIQDIKEKAEVIPSKKVIKKEPPKEIKKVEPKKITKAKQPENFEDAILKSLEQESQKREDKKVDEKFKDLAESLQGDTNKEFNENLPLTISEIDSIKSQITRNWNTTSFSGANSVGMEVMIIITLDINGNVLSAHPKEFSKSSAYYSAFVDSALRSVRLASPLKNLNQSKFGSWKEIEFRFDSSGMIY